MKASVALCTYNGEAFLEEQLTSIFNQTRLPDEVVISDDRSTDGTLAIIHTLSERAPIPVIVLRNEDNLGSTRNFERAISACSGDIIFLSDQDDVWLPRKVELLMREFEADPGVGAVLSDSTVVDEALRPLGFTMFQSCGVTEVRQGRLNSHAPFDEAVHEPFVTGAALAFRADLRRLILPIPLNVENMIHDRWIAAVAVAVSRLMLVETPLILYRQHSRQQLGAPTDTVSAEEYRRRRRARDPSLFSEQLAFLDWLAPFAKTRFGEHTHPGFTHSIDARRRHLRARSDLSEARLARVAPVVRELVSGRYRRFSNGLISAAKDLLLR